MLRQLNSLDHHENYESIKYDDFPVEMSWTPRDSAGTFIAVQSTGCFRADGSAVLATAYVVKVA
jgi:hypothetical protein